MAANKFQKIDCEVCHRTTWHYDGVCGNHSPLTFYKSDDGAVHVRTHAVVDVAQMGSLNKPKPVAPTEAEFRRMNKLDRTMLRAAEDKSAWGIGVRFNQWELAMLEEDPDEGIKDPDKIYCSFCGAETDKIHLTTEKKPHIRVNYEHLRHADGTIERIEKVSVESETIHACQNCCLRIKKPIVVSRV